MAELAFAVLQHLPTPILVLSSSKIAVLVNSAMHRLLGIDEAAPYTNSGVHRDIFYGLSLTEIGINIVQEEHQGWTGWNVSSHRRYSALNCD